MAPTPHTRPATPNDRAFIIEMARHACVIEDWLLPDPRSEEVTSLLPGDRDIAIVAADRSTQAAVGAVWTFAHEPPLVVGADDVPVVEIAIAVTPERRGGGIGTALLDAMAERAADRHRALALNVHRRNPAQHLYARLGFRVVGRGRGDLGLAMVKQL